MPENENENRHRTVLREEVVRILEPKSDRVYVDATLGFGGHSQAVLEAADNVRVIGIDQDREALLNAAERLKNFGDRVKTVHANFSDIRSALADAGELQVDGIIADLGISSMQLDSEERGFSFRFDAPLDMRMDPDSGEMTAAELLDTLSSEEIANIIYQFGEERLSRRIARRIVERREAGEPVKTTRQLAELVEKAIGKRPGSKIHPATRTFQALRIAVNNELEILEGFIRDSVGLLKTDGKMVVITFHSLEDRIVKQTFQKLSGKCFCPPRMPRCECGATRTVELLTKKPIIPAEIEMSENPRSRSAKLRACRKLA